jgi:hypothetical protein
LIRNLLYRLLLAVVEDFPGGMTAVFGYTALIRFALSAQPVDATQALNLSTGVSNPNVSRGRSLS